MLLQRSSHFAILSCLVLATTLTACGKTLDVSKIQDAIKDDVIKKGATSLKSVFCPKDVSPAAGKTFECIGELEGGNAFAISVKQEDAEGKVRWDIPNAKGILNLEKLQAIFLESLKTEKGAPPEINCGGIYRAVKPGDSFDCVVTPKPKSTAKADKSAKLVKASDANAKDAEASKDSEATKDSAKSKSTADAEGTDLIKPPEPADSKDKPETVAQSDQSKETDKKDTDKKAADSSDSKDSNPAKSSTKTDKSKSADKSGKSTKSKVPPGQLVAIRVSVDVEGNITWQQILEDAEVKVATTTSSTVGETTANTGKPEATAAQPNEPATKPEATSSEAKAEAGAPPSSAETQSIED